MSKYLASGGDSPHPPSRENPGLDRISIFRGCLLVKKAITFFKGGGAFFT